MTLLILAMVGAGMFVFGYEVGRSRERALSKTTQRAEQTHLRVVRGGPKDAA